MLNACSSGIGVVNIDNGFGAATWLIRFLNQMVPSKEDFASCPRNPG